jgi:hypothetical protein
MKFFAAIFFAAFSASAQTNLAPAAIADTAMVETNLPISAGQHAEQVRAKCLEGRRLVCGRILQILPNGLVVESGYPDLLRPPLNSSWLIPGSVSVTRLADAVEGGEPGSVCIGTVFLTNFPKARGPLPKPKRYDFVALLGYPTGQYTYTSVGTVQKTVRRFSGDLAEAVNLNVAAEKK